MNADDCSDIHPEVFCAIPSPLLLRKHIRVLQLGKPVYAHSLMFTHNTNSKKELTEEHMSTWD